MGIDVLGDAAVPTPPAMLEVITGLGERVVELDTEIEQLERSLAELNTERNRIQYGELPTLMKEAKMTKFTLLSGVEFRVEPEIKANLPAPGTIAKTKDESEAELLLNRLRSGLTWLRTHKAASLIKNVITVEIGKSGDAAATAIMNFVAKQGLTATRTETVHPSTLVSFVKEQLAKGTAIPFDIFAISDASKAVVKYPKPDKKG